MPQPLPSSRRPLHLPRYLAFLAAVGQFLPNASMAEGFRNPPAGVANLGRAGGRIAHVDDSSAVAQNPANLLDLKSAEAQVSPNIVYISAEYKSPTGQKAESTDPWKVLPNFFGAVPFQENRFAVGLGVTTPYGLSSDWEQDGAFADPTSLRYQSPYYTELKTFNVNPTASARLHERLRVGAGLDVMWSEVTLKQFYPWFLATGNLLSPDGTARAKGDGVGLGGNLGITWEPVDRHRFAVTYRSPMDVDYEGNFSISQVPAVLGGGKSRTDFETSIRFPTIVAVGYGYQLTENIRVEADVEYLEFSRFDSLPIDTGGNLFFPNTTVEQDWQDTFTAGIAGDWRFAPNWIVRLGYQFYESPVPDWTFSPSIPDANQHVFTMGLAYRYKNHSIEVAYGADFYDHRKISENQNAAFIGDYDITVHLFAAGYRFNF